MLINKTKSICPVCRKTVEADIIEKYQSVYMEKECDTHGKYQFKIAKNSWYYKGLINFHDSLFFGILPEGGRINNCSLFLPSKCNLNCDICFSDTNFRDDIEDVTLDTLKIYLSKIKGQHKLIRLTGGEPTMREDLLDIIRIIRKSGNTVSMFSNGIKLLDIEYLKKIKNAGVGEIVIWFDSIKNDNIYKIMRGKELLKLKMAVLSNVKKLGIPFRLYHVKAKGINDSDTIDCLNFVRSNEFIKGMWIRGYTYLGRKGLSIENEYIMDELVEAVANQSRGLFTLEDVYYFQKILYILSLFDGHPNCYYGQVMLVPRGHRKTMDETFKFIKFSKIIDEFEKIWKDNPKKAQIYFKLKFIPKLIGNRPFLYRLIMKKILKRNFEDTRDIPSGYFLLIMSKFYSPRDYDEIRINRQCCNGVLNAGPERPSSLCDLLVKKFG